MCQLFISADDSLWSSKTKSLRIQGVVTSIRLEVFFWDILEELAFRDQMTVNQLITKLYLESLDADHDIGNFTSFLRVCCSRYLSLIADGDLFRETTSPLEEVDAKNIIKRETLRKNQRSALFNGIEQNISIN
ncbi:MULTISPECIES: ribbon-helix-helix domain-containing protein [unclassified Psychrobacter]|uniref:ribbon-helix-helix domain-containing protein n=1 Tax=unclassified Psychrobacter TaxID=196806 RepID=UPI001866B21F|nr:ribbon-helix-helix domain-containing protein [Psychrobacter sp. FME61]